MMQRIQVPKGQGDQLETPPWLFQRLDQRFRFTWDAAATHDNSKVGPVVNCLTSNWHEQSQGGVVFMNPPYSDPGPFVRTAWEASNYDVPVVALLKGDPSTSWWNEWVQDKAHLIWIPRRIRFYYKGLPTEDMSNFPSVLAIYHAMDWEAPV